MARPSLSALLGSELRARTEERGLGGARLDDPSRGTLDDRYTGVYEFALADSDCGATVRLAQERTHIGTSVYSAGVTLCRLLEGLRRRDGPGFMPAGSRVLELGSGTGLLALVAAAALGVEVVATDQAGCGVLENLERNVAANLGPLGLPEGAVEARELDWFLVPALVADAAASEGGTAATMAQLAQRAPDFIIGSDLLYNQDAVDPLLAVLRALLQVNPAAVIVIATDMSGRPGYRRFRELLPESFAVSVTAVEELAELASGTPTERIEVVWLSKRASS